LGDPAGVPMLLAALRGHDEAQRRAAARALAAAKIPEAFEPLLRLAAQTEGFEREEYVAALVAYNDSRAFDVFLAALKDDWYGARLAAVKGLDALGDLRALPALRAATNDLERAVRLTARAALARLEAKHGMRPMDAD